MSMGEALEVPAEALAEACRRLLHAAPIDSLEDDEGNTFCRSGWLSRPRVLEARIAKKNPPRRGIREVFR